MEKLARSDVDRSLSNDGFVIRCVVLPPGVLPPDVPDDGLSGSSPPQEAIMKHSTSDRSDVIILFILVWLLFA